MALGLPVELAMTTVLAFYLWLVLSPTRKAQFPKQNPPWHSSSESVLAPNILAKVIVDLK